MIIYVLYKIIIIGEGNSSPILYSLYILALINYCSAQFGIESWLHPSLNDSNFQSNKTYIQLYNNSHIGLINFNDSLNISNHRLGFKYIKPFLNKNFELSYLKYKSKTNFIETVEYDYFLKMENNYNELLLGYEINKKRISTKINIINNSEISVPSSVIKFETNITPEIILNFEKQNKKKPFELSFGFEDYNFNLKYFYIINNLNKIRFSFLKNWYKIEFSNQLGLLKFNSNKNTLNKILSSDGLDNEIVFKAIFNLNNNKKIDIKYKNNYKEIKLDVIDNINNALFKINKFEMKNNIFLIKYLFDYSKYNLACSFYHRRLDFLVSNRYDLSSDYDFSILFENSTFLNNLSIGNLRQNVISFITKPKVKSNNYYIFQIDWIKEIYDINTDIRGFSLGVPIYNMNEDFNITGKEAINAKLDFILNLKKMMMIFSFSQHIPYKIDKLETTYTTSSGKSQKKQFYGGGKFNFSVIKYF